MSSADDPSKLSGAQLQRTLERMAEGMPADQFARFMEALDWVMDATLGLVPCRLPVRDRTRGRKSAQ
jgi:hypothetical protein